MSEHRRSTVYDYTDLRLHPDGSRVAQKSSNRRPTLIRAATQTSRANWIANDAGGSGIIRQFRKKVASDIGDQEDEEYFDPDFSGTKDVQEATSGSEQESGPKRRKSKRFDGRPLKRQKFKASEEYLTSDRTDFRQTIENDANSLANELSLPEPSPDLLKCIHRFAAEFYTEREELLNISRQWRRQRKERKRLRQLAQDVSDEEFSSSDTSASRSRASSDSESEASIEQDEEEELHEQEGGNSIDHKGKEKARDPATTRKRNEEVFVDMYKRFDGSAIMALGMLVQETVALRLRAEPPAGWTKIDDSQLDPLNDFRKSLLQPRKNPTRRSKRLIKRQASQPRSSGLHPSEEEQNDDDDESLRSEDTVNSDSEADFR